MTKTVVITGAGTATCQGVLKALRSQSEIPVKIVTTDPDIYTAGRYLADEFERIPVAADPDFVDRLLEITKKHKADLLIPIVDMEFIPIAERVNEFDCAVSLSPLESLRRCMEKDKSYLAFDELGLRFPKPIEVSADRPPSGGDLPYPLFIKPRIGRASLDCYRADNRAELDVALSKVSDPLVTEFVEGVEMTIDTLCDLSGSWMGGSVRVREMTKSGVSTKGLIVQNGTILGQARQIVEHLGVLGFGCLQCFNTPDGPVWFEINPRFGGGSILSVAAGFNSPLMLLKSVMGQNVGEYQATGVSRMIRYWQEVFIDGRGREIGQGSQLVRRSD